MALNGQIDSRQNFPHETESIPNLEKIWYAQCPVSCSWKHSIWSMNNWKKWITLCESKNWKCCFQFSEFKTTCLSCLPVFPSFLKFCKPWIISRCTSALLTQLIVIIHLLRYFYITCSTITHKTCSYRFATKIIF